MFTRISNHASTLYTQAKNLFLNKEARKEMLMDAVVIAPYVATDVLLYYVSYLNFLSHLATDPDHPENEPWYLPAYTAGTIVISALMAPALFFAFSDTTGRLFKSGPLKIEDNEYRQLKYPLRRVIGIPGAFTKVLAGDASLYTYLATLIPSTAAIGVACTTAIFAAPALTAFLWGNHNLEIVSKTAPTANEKRIRNFKRVLAYSSSLFYSVDIGFAYYHSALNIPRNMGYIDHSLEQYQNTGEKIGYSIITIGTLIETAAVFLAFSRLNANMFGLIKLNEQHEETGCWPQLEESMIKKGMGSFAVLFKIFNTAVSAVAFFNNKMPLPANIVFVSYSSLCGLVAQWSVLVADPLNTKLVKDMIAQADIESTNGLPENLEEHHASHIAEDVIECSNHNEPETNQEKETAEQNPISDLKNHITDSRLFTSQPKNTNAHTPVEDRTSTLPRLHHNL